jgi:hypothetical protein
MRNAYKILVGKLEENRSFGRRRRKWEYNIRKDLKEVGGEVDRIRYGTAADSCKHGNEPSGSVKGGVFLEYLSDYQLLKKDSSMETFRLVMNNFLCSARHFVYPE